MESKQYSDEQISKIKEMFSNNKTHAEIGKHFGLPRRTIMKLCAKLGLKRSTAEAASLKCKSKLDDENIISKIKEMRNTHSLQEIADILESSPSSVNRICVKYDIILDHDKFLQLQSERMLSSWTDDKKIAAREQSYEVLEEHPEIIKKLKMARKLRRDRQI